MKRANRTVWLVQRRSHDFTAATRFGVVRALFEQDDGTSVFNTKTCLLLTKERLALSQPNDLLLISGSIPLNIIASQVMMWMHGRVNLLIYDVRTGDYLERDLKNEEILKA